MDSRADVFCKSLNTVVDYWFGFKNVFDEEQTSKMIDIIEKSGGNADKEIIAWTAIATEITSSALRGQLLCGGHALDRDSDKPIFGRLVDVLCSHWRDFNLDEKAIITDFIIDETIKRGAHNVRTE